MSESKRTLAENAIASYKASQLAQADIEKFKAEVMALGIMLHELGYELTEPVNIIEVDGIIFTAKHGGHDGLLRFEGIGYSVGMEPTPEHYNVGIKVHAKCPLCGEMRHSEDIRVIAPYAAAEPAARVGKFLLQNHNCKTTEEKRKVGLIQ